MAPRSLIVLPLLLFACHAVAQTRCPGGSGCPSQFNEKHKAYSRSSSTEPEGVRALRAAVGDALSLYEKGDHAGAARMLDGATSKPEFDALPAAQRRQAWTVLARIDLSERRPVRGIERLKRAIAADDSDPDLWYWLAMSEHDQGQHEAAARSFTELAERWPELLDNIDSADVYRLQARLRDGSREKLDFLQTLFDARWDDPVGDASILWHELALMRLARGEVEDARAAIRRIVRPAVIVSMRSDKRFDPLVDRDAWAFNPQRAAARAVEAMRAKSDARPDDLDVKVQLTYALLAASDHEGVIRLVDAALEAPPPGGASDTHEDAAAARAEQHAWLLNNRAIALYRLGRTQEALADMVRARSLPVAGGVNISQTLNLGELHCTLGRAADAGRMADAIDAADAGQVSDYGRLFQARVRLCAAWLAQDEKGMRRAYATIRQGRAHDEGMHLDALVMLGRLDEAAQDLIRLLASPDDRTHLLSAMQRYRQVTPTPTLERLRAQYQALLARDDVKAAIERVGRREDYDMYFGYGFD